jgi:transposase
VVSSFVFSKLDIMLSLDSNFRYELYLPPTDMRKSFDSLCGIVQSELSRVPTNGSVFIFVNRLHNKMKLLHWRTGGFVLYYKRLEKGTFELPLYDDSVRSLLLDYTQLVLFLDGITIGNLSQKKRYKP